MEHHNPYVECPYDRAHQVPKLRLQYHLVKCRKQHPGTEMKVCPFNATHIMPEPELKMHFWHCEDRSLIEGQKYNFLSADHGDLGNPTFHHDVSIEKWKDTNKQNKLTFFHDPEKNFVKDSSIYLQKNNHDSKHSIRSPSHVSDDEDRPGGALGVSSYLLPENGGRNSINVGERCISMGRGQINHLLAQMGRGARS